MNGPADDEDERGRKEEGRGEEGHCGNYVGEGRRKEEGGGGIQQRFRGIPVIKTVGVDQSKPLNKNSFIEK